MSVPALVAAKGGERWVSELPTRIAALQRLWGIVAGQALSGGTSAYTARVTTASGEPAVLKISVPEVGFAQEVETLVAAAGRGYVRVLDVALDLDAVLLEPLGGSLSTSGLAPEAQLGVLADLLRVAWQTPHDGVAVVDKAARLLELVEGLRPWGPGPTVDRALWCAERRSAAFDPDRCVLLHGDAAAANVLRRAEHDWVFVDPDGFVGDPDYDRGVALRDWCSQLLAARDPRQVLASYGHLIGGDQQAVWEWAFLERVSTGLYVSSLGGDGRPHLDTAAAVLPSF